MIKITEIFYFSENEKIEIPLFLSKVKAGFPSPADDYIEKKLDLNELLIKHKSSTFFLKVEGDSMINAGINSGDILIVDRSLEIKDSSIVIAAINGELTVKRLNKVGQKILLIPENPKYDPIEITGEQELMIWGVVTYVIHKVF